MKTRKESDKRKFLDSVEIIEISSIPESAHLRWLAAAANGKLPSDCLGVFDIKNIKAADGTSLVFIAALAGTVPEWTRVEDLMYAKDKDGNSALKALSQRKQFPEMLKNVTARSDREVAAVEKLFKKRFPKEMARWLGQERKMNKLYAAAKTGKYPRGTTAKNLADARVDDDGEGFGTALHVAAWHGHLPRSTKADDLINAKGIDGWSAFHRAAQCGHLPKGVTIQDVIMVDDQKATFCATIWEELAHGGDKQVSRLLKATSTRSKAEFRKIAKVIQKHIGCNDDDLTQWLQREAKRHIIKSATGQ